MNKEKSLDGTGQSHSQSSMFFLYVIAVCSIINIMISIINMIYLGFQPTSEIQITHMANDYYYLDFFIGSGTSIIGNVIGGMTVINPKVFSIAFIIQQLIMVDIPFLLVLNYLRKMIKAIGASYSAFIPESVMYTKKAGNILFIVGMIGFFIGGLGGSALIWVFAGTILLLFSSIFKRGCSLQQDVDETI
ncbi:hypothetical protein ACTQ6A_12470 [Lachnospiraceae bacterium LCP25S3_G4]